MTMYKPILRIQELKHVLIRFRVVETALDAVIIFLSLFVVLSYAGISSMWALFLPPVLFFFIALRYRTDANIIKLIEKRYPSLRERLGALYDSRDEKNAVVDDLAASVSSDMDGVKYSSFISTSRLGIRTTVILLLVTFVLSSALTHSPKNPMQTEGPGTIDLPESTGSGASPDIFDEPSVVKIGNDSQGVLIYRSQGSELNVRGDGKPVSGYSTMFPPETSSSEMYQEAVPAVYQQIVKNYFTNLTVQD
ncbi:MAG: hypothetical protein KKA10_11505 [Euryarchaeota archaeon]|nr:hypothetical protein [Euryarchaeota archaeon]MCG2736618.1 hypothetical protein [Candidatus Methanoperedenaceae archaeon]